MSSSLPLDGSVVTVQELFIKPSHVDAFLARFKDLDVLGTAAGAAGGGLDAAVMVQDGSRFLVITRWASEAGIAAWIGSEARELVRTELESFYESSPAVSRYPIRVSYPALAAERLGSLPPLPATTSGDEKAGTG